MMHSIELRTLMVNGIRAAIKKGKLPDYEFNVSVSSGTVMQTVTVYTWLADLDAVQSVLASIFNKCGCKCLFNVLHPPTKRNPAMSYDENLKIWEDHVKAKVEEFYTAKPEWRPPHEH